MCEEVWGGLGGVLQGSQVQIHPGYLLEIGGESRSELRAVVKEAGG